MKAYDVGAEAGMDGGARGFTWNTLFEAPSETEKFAAIEALFNASGMDLSTIRQTRARRRSTRSPA